MILKPRKRVENTKATLYRRYIGLQSVEDVRTIYHTIEDNKFWAFNGETLEFEEIEGGGQVNTIEVESATSCFKYMQFYFRYYNFEWQRSEELWEGLTPLSATFNNVAKYQTNKYYRICDFDYVVTGSVVGTTTQQLRGNIMPLTSLNIKYYNDNVKMQQDDLVVIENHLYSVENPETSYKYIPKKFCIYYATLNSVL